MGLISTSERVSAERVGQGLEVAAATAKGVHRPFNEDAFGILDGYLVVVDGGGGRPEPSVAARALEHLERTLAWSSQDMGPADPLARAIRATNEVLHEEFQRDVFAGSLSATLAAARLGSGWLTVAHVGDGRVGRLRKGHLGWLTEDQSLLTLARRSGAPPESIADVERKFPTVLTSVMGVDRVLCIEVGYHPLEEGDLVLLCTDGLWRQVSQRAIEAIIRDNPALPAACAALVRAAAEAGGMDDVAVLLARVRP